MKVLPFLTAALFLASCGAPSSEESEAQANPSPEPPSKTSLSSELPSAQPEEEAKGAWPERPEGVLLEARIEGVLPTLTAALTQARQVGEIPPLEIMASSMLGAFLGLSDVSVIDLTLPTGALLLDVGAEPAPLVYLGISSEEAFRKAFPASAMTADPKGNALAYTPPPASALFGNMIYLNFVGSYAVGSPNPEAFALVKAHLEAILSRKTGAPSLWVAAETEALWKKYGPLASSAIEGISTEATASLGSSGFDFKTLFQGFFDFAADVDEVEIRHNPGKDVYSLQIFVTPRSGSAWGTRLAKPGEISGDLAKKLPSGWMGGVAYVSPETVQAIGKWAETVFPTLTTSFPGISRLYSLFTGNVAFSTNGGPGSSLIIAGISDEAEARKISREIYAAPKRVSFGTFPAMEYAAIEIDAEEISGVKVDRLTAGYDLSTASPQQAAVFATMGLSTLTYRYAYLPGLLVIAAGDDTRGALEKLLKGEPGAFTASTEVTTTLAALPKERRLGAFFFSFPQAMSAFSSRLPMPFTIPPTKTGAGFGWSVQGDRLRIDLVVPITHILEIKTAILAAQGAFKSPPTPLKPPSPPAPAPLQSAP